MTRSAHTAASADVFRLDPAVRNTLEEMSVELAATGGETNSSDWLLKVREYGLSLPLEFRRELRALQRHSGEAGSLLVRGLPVGGSVPPTPMASGSVQRSTTVPAALLMLVACSLGEPVAFRAEKSGVLVQDVVPVPGSEDFQGNEGSVLLSFHTENAFHQHRPDYVLLLCLRADHERVSGLRVACIRRAYPRLDATTKAALRRAEFVTVPPPSFGSSGAETPPHAVLCGDPADPDIVVDFAATRPLTPAANTALLALQDNLAATADTHYLERGDLAIVDNHVALHGRTAFQPRYDGRDRWLQRAFSVRDLRRSRDHRPKDGHVLVR